MFFPANRCVGVIYVWLQLLSLLLESTICFTTILGSNWYNRKYFYNTGQKNFDGRTIAKYPTTTTTTLGAEGTTTTTTTTIQRRSSKLLPWTKSSTNGSNEGSPTIGWALEEKISRRTTTNTDNNNDNDNSNEVIDTITDRDEYTVTIGWGCNNNDDNISSNDSTNVKVRLPSMTNEDTLGSTVWPSSIAGAILCQSPLVRSQLRTSSSIVELGCGLGLKGLALMAALGNPTTIKCQLTDNDSTVIQLLQEFYNDSNAIQASVLDWRDTTSMESRNENDPVDIILGADVAYYYYLQRPLIDTIKCYDPSTVLITGQANRQSQWDFYDAIARGCYNQITDQNEEPLDGTTQMLLYRFSINDWVTTTTTSSSLSSFDDYEETNGSSEPSETSTDTKATRNARLLNVATIVHQKNRNETKIRFTEQFDHIATKDDKYSLYID